MRKEEGSEENNVIDICKKCAKDFAKHVQKKMKDDKIVAKEGDYIKIGFSQDKSSESMWVRITYAGNKSIRGILNNDPMLLTNIKAGDSVICKKEDIQAYISKDQTVMINPLADMVGLEVDI